MSLFRLPPEPSTFTHDITKDKVLVSGKIVTRRRLVASDSTKWHKYGNLIEIDAIFRTCQDHRLTIGALRALLLLHSVTLASGVLTVDFGRARTFIDYASITALLKRGYLFKHKASRGTRDTRYRKKQRLQLSEDGKKLVNDYALKKQESKRYFEQKIV